MADRSGPPRRHRRRAEPWRRSLALPSCGSSGSCETLDRAAGGPVFRVGVPRQRPAVRGPAVRRGAFAGGLIAEAAAGSAAALRPDTLAVGRQVTGLLLHVYAMRMAAVFTMSTATITLRTKVVPRWIGMLGFAVAVVLLVSVRSTAWVELVSPARILLLSVEFLRTGSKQSPGAARTAIGAQA